MDILAAITLYYPAFTARASGRKMPFVGNLAQCMSTIFIKRTGEDAKAQKKEAIA
jgi:1-acyl-sn-glycerol-3-phosphate acyltransferase